MNSVNITAEIPTLVQIDAGELVKQIEQGILSCIEDIRKSEDLPEKRNVAINITLTPKESGEIKVSYDVTPKLAKRGGDEIAFIDKLGRLRFGETQERQRLPLSEEYGSQETGEW